MDTVDVSLVTYTYNDGHFVDGLLASLPSWTLAPREIIVADDGSTTPYAPPACPLPLTLLRHGTNRGIPATKHEAISAGTSAYLLAMDCDTRVTPTWLETCLPLAARPEVGLVSGPVVYLSGDDLVSRYQRVFGDNHNLEKTGDTDFVPGNVFLLRRAVWEACGGMAGFDREVCEDHFLCGRIRALGLSLRVDARARARQTRRISRLAMLQRYWRWCREALIRAALERCDLPAFILVALALPHAARLETCLTLGEPMFVYLEALYLSYTTLDLLGAAAAAGRADAALPAAWWAGLKRIFGGHATLWAALRADLARLGQPFRPGFPTGAENPFAPSLEALEALRQGSLFDWMSRQGVPAMLAEERAQTYDFSFYDATSGSAP
jgi:GT2 family glycosyltransferase